MPPRGANTSASARKPGGEIGRNLPRSLTNAVSRTAVSAADIAHMASSTATSPSTPAASASIAPRIRHSPRIEEIRQRGALSGGGQFVGGQRPPLPRLQQQLATTTTTTTRNLNNRRHFFPHLPFLPGYRGTGVKLNQIFGGWVAGKEKNEKQA